jgi:hypothetical protein
LIQLVIWYKRCKNNGSQHIKYALRALLWSRKDYFFLVRSVGLKVP